MKKIKIMNPWTGRFDDALEEGGIHPISHNRFVSNAGIATTDTKMLSIEIYNKLNEDITFVKASSDYPGPQLVKCKALDWCNLPHSYYIGTTKSGRPCEVVVNLGDKKGVGNKLPSRLQ